MVMQSAGATYTDPKTGTKLTPYTDGNQSGTVLAGSVFDPNSSNYNPLIANSGGKIALSDLDSGSSNGLSAAYNAGNGANSADNLRNAIYGSSDGPSNSYPTLQSVVQGSSALQPVAQGSSGATNNSTQISNMYDQSLAAAQAALKASIQASMGNYQDTITKAPSQFQPLRDQASASGAQNMQNLREMLANNGQQGGVNRTEETNVNSATENNINSLNQQQQQVIDTANKAINDLKAQGDIKGAELVAQNATDRIKALIDESNRVDAENYKRSQDAFNNGINIANLTGNYNGQSTLAAQQLQNQIANDKFNQGIQTAGLTGTYNGQQTMQGANNAANIAASNAQTAGQLIQNQYAPQIEQGKIDAQAASTAYQNMVNLNYPKEEALKIAGIVASNEGQTLDNNAKALANQYQPQILQGQIDGQKLQNAYQAMVNAGYPQEQAAKIAAQYAQIRQGDAQIDISRQNANTSSSNAAWAQNPNNPDNIYKNAQINAINNKSGDLVGQATSYVMQQVYGNNNSAQGALNTLTSNKGSILSGLTQSGMSYKDAMAYYNSMEQDLMAKGAK